LGLETRRREEVVFGSLLHDVGKIGISELLLLKPGPLSPEEYNIVKLHPRIGYRLVQQVPALDAIALGILHHHERYDGRGYPAGLKGQEIPQEARIICVADAFSAMTSDRPYRGRLSVAEACSELERFAGAQFDPEIVRLFVDEVKRQPPEEEMNALATALADPELEARRTGGDAILGQSPFALTDSLTLLYSHRYFHEQLDAQAHRAAVQGSPFALALFELQQLSEINVRDGYAAGDAAIQRAARALHRSAARSGATACRVSGKRLALVIPHVDESDAHALAAELASELPDLSVRVGVAAWRRGDAARDVLERALADLAAARTALPA
jgi:diguanylate cyclase (GGDEF)-like protein